MRVLVLLVLVGCWRGPMHENPAVPLQANPAAPIERFVLRVDDACRRAVNVPEPEWPTFERCAALLTSEETDACEANEARWAMIQLYAWIGTARWKCATE